MNEHSVKTFLDVALEEARLAAERGDVPVGAVVVQNNTIIARAGNEVTKTHDPAGHAEIIALRRAGLTLTSKHLIGCDLYVTLEPCTMCAGAISLARIRRLYYGASDEKGGAVENGARFFSLATCHHAPEVYSGFQEAECSALLRDFFKARRDI